MQRQIEILVVGRSNSRSKLDIAIPTSEDTVGRRHAEITIGSNGDCYLVDLGSANGTFVCEKGKWKSIQQAPVSSQTPIRLGTYETTIDALLRFRVQETPPELPTGFGAQPPQGAKPAPAQAGRRPRRNPTTGQIE